MDKKSINSTIINLLKHYKKKLEKHGFRIERMFLFGSQVKGTAKSYSDIDVAIVSQDLSGDSIDDYVALRIEPHPFKPKDFADYWNPLATEIKRYGIPI